MTKITLIEKGFIIPGEENPIPFKNTTLIIDDIKIKFQPDPYIDKSGGVTYWRGLDIEVEADKEIYLVKNNHILFKKD